MAEKKPEIQRCKVIRAFYLNGEIQKPKAVIELDQPFATEMKASLKVEFVGKTKTEDAKTEDVKK